MTLITEFLVMALAAYIPALLTDYVLVAVAEILRMWHLKPVARVTAVGPVAKFAGLLVACPEFRMFLFPV